VGEAYVTKHGTKRIRQRLGLNKKSVEKQAQKALNYGVSHKEATGKLCQYMNGVFLLNYRPTNMRAYNRMLYLFREDKLITVLHLPNRYWAQADKLQQRKSEVMRG